MPPWLCFNMSRELSNNLCQRNTGQPVAHLTWDYSLWTQTEKTPAVHYLRSKWALQFIKITRRKQTSWAPNWHLSDRCRWKGCVTSSSYQLLLLPLLVPTLPFPSVISPSSPLPQLPPPPLSQLPPPPLPLIIMIEAQWVSKISSASNNHFSVSKISTDLVLL